jgi:GNAT superfamily N-acetyltransferase
MTPEKSTANIRAGRPEDLSRVMTLIRELAEFEKLTPMLEVTQDKLHQHIFAADAHVKMLVLELNNQIIGYALYFKTFSSFLGAAGYYLEDIYVQPQFRGQGYGRKVIATIAAEAVENGYRRVEWSVLNWNQKAIDFYKSLGAVPLSEWAVYRLTGEALTNMQAELNSNK